MAILADVEKKIPERDRRYARYFTLAHLYNAGLSEDELQTYRHGLSKLVNIRRVRLEACPDTASICAAHIEAVTYMTK